MGKKRIAKRSKVKPFIKVRFRALSHTPGTPVLIRPFSRQVINYAHLLPTRYALELETLKGSVSAETFKEPTQREDAKKAIKKSLEERYQRGANRWFFTKLRF